MSMTPEESPDQTPNKVPTSENPALEQVLGTCA